MYSRIAGTGSYLPEKILTNADLEKLVDTSDEWIRSRTGIRQRHVAAEGDHHGPCRACGAACDRGGGSDRSGHRFDLRGHDDAGFGISECGHLAAGPLGYSRVSGLQPRSSVHRLHVRAERRGQIRALGGGEMCAGGRS